LLQDRIIQSRTKKPTMEPMTMPAMAPPLRSLLLLALFVALGAFGAVVTVTVVCRTPSTRETAVGRVAVGSGSRKRGSRKGGISIGENVL